MRTWLHWSISMMIYRLFYEWYVFSWHPPIIYVIFAKINFCRRRKNSFDHVDWVRRTKLLLSNFIFNNIISFSIEHICKQCDSFARNHLFFDISNLQKCVGMILFTTLISILISRYVYQNIYSFISIKIFMFYHNL